MMTNQMTSIYLLSNEQDIHWGLTVSTVGYQHIAPGEAYPPKGHPQAYSFQAGRGRVLDEYQFVYISRGRGVFESKSFGQGRHVSTLPRGVAQLPARRNHRMGRILDRIQRTEHRQPREQWLLPAT